MILGRQPLKIWVLVAEFILGMDILHAHDASVDIGRKTQCLEEEEELSLWNPGAGLRRSSLTVEENKVIPAQCERIFMARLEGPLERESALVEPVSQAHPPEGIYIAKTLIKDRQKVPVRPFNITYRDHKLTRGYLLAHCELFTLVTTPDLEEPQAQDLSSKLQDIIETMGNIRIWKNYSPNANIS
jgi:hypothetical protein